MMSNTSVEFGGMLPAIEAPYPRSGGIISRRWPPTFIPATPRSHPAITRPTPSWNEKFVEESNCVPFDSSLVGSYSQPVYETMTIRPCVAVAPVPSRRSVIENGADGGGGVFDGELSLPPPQAAAPRAIPMTSAMRTGTVNNVRSRLANAIQ